MGHTTPLYWTGISNDARIEGLDKIKTTVDSFAFIMDFHFFSDLSVSLVISVQSENILPLKLALSTFMNVDDNPLLAVVPNTEHTILFNITFTKGSGNLRIEVPQIPG